MTTAAPPAHRVHGPVRIETVDLGRPLAGLAPRTGPGGLAYRRARVLVLLHDVPVGVVWVDLDGPLAAADLAARVLARLGRRIAPHLPDARVPTTADLLRGLPGPAGVAPRTAGTGPWVSVVLATRGRPAHLPAAIDGLLASDHPGFEVVVVDNGPEDPRTAAVVAQRYAGDGRVRLVTEPRPGLSHARNRGMRAARGDVVAFTDDDVVVHPTWLRRLTDEFADPVVACVTGLVEPARLDTPAQRHFEAGAVVRRGTDRKVYHLDHDPDRSPLFPYRLGGYGTGASMALRRSSLPDGWTFDPALGAGSPAQGGEDIDLFLDVVLGGRVLVYQPAALSFHTHRADADALHRQMRGYGRGLTALLVKRLVRRPGERRRLLRGIAPGVRHALGPDFRRCGEPGGDVAGRGAAAPAPYPWALLLREVLGMVEGPVAYAVGVGRAAAR